jgi:ABC-type nitrate/sulfonate/bicarbonate transport system permease component
MATIEHTQTASLQVPAAGDFFRRHRKVILPIVLLVLILVWWEFVAQTGMVSKLVLAGPSAIVIAMIAQAGPLSVNTGITVAQALIGFVIGNFAGLAVAVIFVHSDLARRTIYPLAIGAEAVPVVAVLPVLILWLGNGMEPKIFITAFLTFFPMLVNAFRGLRSADAEVSELLYTLSASPWQKLTMIRLPASVPFLFNALKLSACSSVVASLVAEWLASNQGLGFLIILYGQAYKIPEVWAAAIVASAASLAVYGAVVFAEYKLTPWLRARQSDL